MSSNSTTDIKQTRAKRQRSKVYLLLESDINRKLLELIRFQGFKAEYRSQAIPTLPKIEP